MWNILLLLVGVVLGAVVIYVIWWGLKIRRGLKLYKALKDDPSQFFRALNEDPAAQGRLAKGRPEDVLINLLAQKQKQADTPPNDTPDRPGLYVASWIAVRSDDAMAVMDVLYVQECTPCNWQTASIILNSIMSSRVFISPSIDGWVLISGAIPEPAFDQPEHASRPDSGLVRFLFTLSRQFGDAQYFMYHDYTSTNAWAWASNGQLVRAYCIHGYSNTVVWNDGSITDGERAAGLVYGESGFKGVLPEDFDDSEAQPIYCDYECGANMVAAQWSLDPADGLAKREDLPESVGTLGSFDYKAVRDVPERPRPV